MQPVHKELSTLRLSQQVLIILIFSLVTIVVWIGLSLFSSQSKTAITSESQSLATPLNPSLNVDVLEEIEQKQSYDINELSSFPIYLLTIEGDKQRLSQNRQSIPTETVAEPTPPPNSNLNSLLPPVTIDPTTSESGREPVDTPATQPATESGTL